MLEKFCKLKKLTIKVNADGIIRNVTDGFGGFKDSNFFWNINDTLVINVQDETIEYIRNKFEGNQIKMQCHFEEIIKSRFEDINASELFTEFPNKPEDIVIDDDLDLTYEIFVEAENIPSRVIKGRYCMEELPKDYPQIIHIVSSIIDEIEPWGDIFNAGIYARPSRRKSDIIYCGVEFSEFGYTYHYITDDDSIEVGDKVIVPVGNDNREMKGYVSEKQYCTKDDVPYPLSKVKKIIRKIESVESCSENVAKIKNLVGKRIKAIRLDFTSIIGVMTNFYEDAKSEEFHFYIQTENEKVLVTSEELRRIELREE